MTDDELIEHKIDGEVLYEGRILRLEVDRIRFADGGEGRREVVRHGGAVVLLPLTDDGRVLLVRQYRYPTAEILLELPAGTLERGEEPAACAARELEEETGHRAGELVSLGAFYSAPGFSDEKLHGFLARGLKPSHELTADDDEHLVGQTTGQTGLGEHHPDDNGSEDEPDRRMEELFERQLGA